MVIDFLIFSYNKNVDFALRFRMFRKEITMKNTKLFTAGWTTCLILFLMFSNTLQAQSDSCIAKAPSEVGVGRQFKYTVSTTEKGEVISTDFGKFELISGPSIGTSTSITMVGGSVEQSTTYTYTYYLSCDKEGDFSIPGVTFSFDGRLVKSNFVVVHVVKAPKNQPQEQESTDNWFHFEMPQMPSMEDFGWGWPFGDNSQQPHNNNNNNNNPKKNEKVQVEDKIGKDDMFVKASTTKLEAFQGEAVIITHKLYVKSDINGYSIQRAVFAPTSDFWMDALDLSQRDHNTETINGKSYNVYTIKQTAAYPTTTGKLTIPKLDLSLVLRVPTTVKDPFWGTISTYRNKEVKLVSNDLSLKVKAMPGTNSTTKTEVVGNFSASSSLNKTTVRTNEAIVLTITISGSGNLHHVDAADFNIDFPSDCDVTYPRINAHISAKGDIITGSKSFKYTIIPREEGTYLIPGITYTYYDYDTGSYRTITTQDYQIEVTPGKQQAPSNDNDEPAKKNKPAKTYKI